MAGAEHRRDKWEGYITGVRSWETKIPLAVSHSNGHTRAFKPVVLWLMYLVCDSQCFSCYSSVFVK